MEREAEERISSAKRGTEKGQGRWSRTVRDGTCVQQDSRDLKEEHLFRWNWGSPHTAGVQFIFADGSVWQVLYATPPNVVDGLLSPSGGEVVNDSFFTE
jgi:hypothetical protein